MRLGWLSSLGLHLIAVLASVAVWPQSPRPLPEASAVVPVEILDFSDQSNIKAIAPAAPLEEIEQPEEQGDPLPAEAALEKPVETELLPEPAPPKKPPKPQTQPLDLDKLALLLDKEKKKPGAKPDPNAAKAERGEKPRPGAGAGDALTVSERDALKAQMRECWRAPVDAPEPERLIVRVRFDLERDGALSGQPELISPRVIAPADTHMRVAAENAVRAVRQCAPFKLPPEKYERWREIVFTFDPREMLSQ